MNINIPAESLITPEFEQALQRSLEKVLPAVLSKLAATTTKKLLLNSDEVAESLSMSRRSWDTIVARDGLPVVRLTNRPQFRPETIEQYLEEAEKKGEK